MKYWAIFLLLICMNACKPNESTFHGYVEGEYIYLAPTTGGILKDLLVRRGDQVKEGQDLFAIDDIELKANIATAEAEVAQANAGLKNLIKGKRSEEIEVILKQQDQARAHLQNSKQEYERAKMLISSKAISKSNLDKVEAEYRAARANVAEVAAQLKVATLGAREDEIAAAQATLDIAGQRLIQFQKRLEDSAPKAPATGYIENTFFRVGEYVSPGKPVVSLLPPENIKIRFFVPQSYLPKLKLGQKIKLNCDGCTNSMTAKINYISTQAEYTPPVIYSKDSRDKLVFMVEALPEQLDAMLRPGLPLDIEVQ